MKRISATDPFAALELPAQPGLTDDDVRSAWRRIAAATHPDRDDGGDPARFAEAAAAYTALRTPFGRGEAFADLAGARSRRRYRQRPPFPRWAPRARRERQPRPGTKPHPGHPVGKAHLGSKPRGGSQGRRWIGPRLAFGRFWSRVRRGRPGRLALRIVAAGTVSAGSVLVDGAHPATPALITGALTWLALTARHDLAAPDTPMRPME